MTRFFILAFIWVIFLPRAFCEETAGSLVQLLRNAHLPEYQYQIINTYSHDNHHFTEGLFFQDGYMYESTGLYGKSRVFKTVLSTGEVVRKTPFLESRFFGEGMTVLNEDMYQLTWHEGKAFVYDKNSFAPKKNFLYAKQGWGLTSDGKYLIMSNGSATLAFRDPQSFKIVRTIPVTAGATQISSINELEYIEGMIYANIWPTSIIVIISPQTGEIQAWFSLKEKPPACADCVANGIAWNQQENLIYVTGKYWPNLYAIRIIK